MFQSETIFVFPSQRFSFSHIFNLFSITLWNFFFPLISFIDPLCKVLCSTKDLGTWKIQFPSKRLSHVPWARWNSSNGNHKRVKLVPLPSLSLTRRCCRIIVLELNVSVFLPPHSFTLAKCYVDSLRLTETFQKTSKPFRFAGWPLKHILIWQYYFYLGAFRFYVCFIGDCRKCKSSRPPPQG